MSVPGLFIRSGGQAVMLLLLVLLAASVYGDTGEQVQEHESLLVLDVENMT